MLQKSNNKGNSAVHDFEENKSDKTICNNHVDTIDEHWTDRKICLQYAVLFIE